MARPIVIAHHLIWTAQGWWLPNDPRGSSSNTIASDLLADLGALHYGRKVVQPASKEIRAFYRKAAPLLKFPLMRLGSAEVECAAEAFAACVEDNQYTCYACAILPDHVHVLIRKHKHKAERMIANLQEASRLRLRTLGLRSRDHPVWGGPGWKVFLDHPDGVRRSIRYVEENAPTQRMPRQPWAFVREYDGWPLHPGHSPNSPYVQRLRKRNR